MKIKITDYKKIMTRVLLVAGVALSCCGQAEPVSEIVISNRIISADDSAPAAAAGNMARKHIVRIESIQPDQGKESSRQVTWLGISTEDVTEALTAQLGLKSGQGLVVIFVAPDSPAAKAGIQKFDVIEKFDDQILVDAEQLRKLVQMQKEGDTVKLTVHRGGKNKRSPLSWANELKVCRGRRKRVRSQDFPNSRRAALTWAIGLSQIQKAPWLSSRWTKK